MKYANACRVNKGRTGPKGEEGTRAELYGKLGREPDPDEVEYKMGCKKGYDSVMKKTAAYSNLKTSLSQGAGDGGLQREDVLEEKEESLSVSTGKKRKAAQEDMEKSSISSMQRELEQLQRDLEKARQAAEHQSVQDVGPSSSFPPAVEGSNGTGGVDPATQMSVNHFLIWIDMY